MRANKNITSPRVLYIKAGLFLLTGILASLIIVAEAPTLKVASLLVVCIWSFARAYYFAFYVIERYIDPSFRFAGLWSFARYAVRRGTADRGFRGGEKIG